MMAKVFVGLMMAVGLIGLTSVSEGEKTATQPAGCCACCEPGCFCCVDGQCGCANCCCCDAQCCDAAASADKKETVKSTLAADSCCACCEAGCFCCFDGVCGCADCCCVCDGAGCCAAKAAQAPAKVPAKAKKCCAGGCGK